MSKNTGHVVLSQRLSIAIFCSCLLTLCACTKESPTDSEVSGPTISVLVRGYGCQSAGPGQDAPYSFVASGTAEVLLIDANGSVHSLLTNSESIATLAVDTGWYGVRVEPDLGYPHSFDSVHIGGDTTLEVTVQTRFRDSDTLAVVFGIGPGYGNRKLPDGAYRTTIAIYSVNHGNVLDTSGRDHWPMTEVTVGSVTFRQYLIRKAPGIPIYAAHDSLRAFNGHNYSEVAYAGAFRYRWCPGDTLPGPTLPLAGD